VEIKKHDNNNNNYNNGYRLLPLSSSLSCH